MLKLFFLVVTDYMETFGKLRRFPTDFKGTISQKKVFRCVYTSNSNNFKISKSLSLKKKSGVRVFVDYADSRFLNFAIEYLLLCMYCLFIWGPCQPNKKIGRKSRDTVPLSKWHKEGGSNTDNNIQLINHIYEIYF